MKRHLGADNIDCHKRAKVSQTFCVMPIHRFDRRFPYFGRPREISHFSTNVISNEIFFNRIFLKYLYEKNIHCNLNLDLKEGYKSFISHDDGPGSILTIIDWFEMYFGEKDKYKREKSDFLCWRGLLSKLLVAPYEKSDGWIFVAQKFCDTIFLLELETQQRIEGRKNKTTKENEMSYWGFKFEQYMTSDRAEGQPITDVPVNNTMNFVSMVRTHLGNHSLIFGGEVDCCTKENGEEYVELKTSRHIDTMKQRNNFNRYKLIKWWAQSFLLGIPKIVCGFRDDDGIVHSAEIFRTFDIPRLSNSWSGNICFNFCNDLLQFVKDVIKNDDRIYKFEWSPGCDVQYEVVADLEVVPQEFKNKFKHFC